MEISQKKKLLSLCLVGALVLPAGTAFADDAADAATFYHQASEAYQAEDYTRADELLDRAYAKDPDLIYQYNRVLANQAKGDFEAALQILDTYQDQMAADPDARFTDVPEMRANLEVLAAEARQAQGGAGEEEPHEIEIIHLTSPDAPVEEQEGVSTAKILGWSLVGVGVAGLGASALFGSKVFIPEVADRFNCETDGGGDCYAGFGSEAEKDAQFEADKESWNTQNTLTWVSLSVGAAALIGGGVVLYMDAQDSGEATASAGTKLEWTPYVSADGAGGTFNLSF